MFEEMLATASQAKAASGRRESHSVAWPPPHRKNLYHGKTLRANRRPSRLQEGGGGSGRSKRSSGSSGGSALRSRSARLTAARASNHGDEDGDFPSISSRSSRRRRRGGEEQESNGGGAWGGKIKENYPDKNRKQPEQILLDTNKYVLEFL